jgi:general stress protein 26
MMWGGRCLRPTGFAARRAAAGAAKLHDRRRLRKVDMDTPRASRPYMPGYGILGPTKGSGLLPWSWAEQRLVASRNYWVASRWPDGRPHAMPVWGVWHDGSFWFSSSRRSRKARNLAADPRCMVTTENAVEPVVVEGTAEVVTDPVALTRMLALENAKYATDYAIELLDPAVNATIRVRPRWASGWPRETSPVRPPVGSSNRNEPSRPQACTESLSHVRSGLSVGEPRRLG